MGMGNNAVTFKDVLRSLIHKKMLVVLLLGFSSGLPYLLIFKTLQGWLVSEGLSLKQIGYISMISLGYSCKFLWAPFMDRYSIGRMGRRRGWLLITQILLILSVYSLAEINPAQNLGYASVLGLIIGFLGASQDIVVDAFRRESVADQELGLASATYQLGYRGAMWVSGGLAFILSDHIGWSMTYKLMSLLFFIGIATTLWAEEPDAPPTAPHSIKDAVVQPLKEFFSRDKAYLVVIFILLYKVGDSFAGNMLTPFYNHLGFSNTEIGAVAKTFGMVSTIAGAFIGGAVLVKMGIVRALYIFGILQSLSTLSFAGLYFLGHDLVGFAACIFLEDFSAGMGSAAFMAFMASMTNRSYTATQYALLTSLMAFTARFISAPAGHLAESLGWPIFFTVCAAAAIPGLFVIKKLRNLQTS